MLFVAFCVLFVLVLIIYYCFAVWVVCGLVLRLVWYLVGLVC